MMNDGAIDDDSGDHDENGNEDDQEDGDGSY